VKGKNILALLKRNKVWILIALLFSAMATVGFVGVLNAKTEPEYFDCYRVTAPFGKLWVETRGGFVMIMGTGVGSIRGSLDEAYIVKYYVGDEIHTVILDAEKTPVVVDGTFRLERIEDSSTLAERDKSSYHTYKYKIHIPILPLVNQTITYDWE